MTDLDLAADGSAKHTPADVETVVLPKLWSYQAERVLVPPAVACIGAHIKPRPIVSRYRRKHRRGCQPYGQVRRESGTSQGYYNCSRQSVFGGHLQTPIRKHTAS